MSKHPDPYDFEAAREFAVRWALARQELTCMFGMITKPLTGVTAAIVEVPGYVDRNGISIPRVGDLPMGCAAVCNASITVQRMAVKAGVEGDDTLLRQAMMMDPLVGAVCNPPEIWQMVDELLVAQSQWLPQYTEAVEAAKARLEAGREAGTLIPVREGYAGAARLKTKTVEEMRQDREAANRNAGETDKAKERPAERA